MPYSVIASTNGPGISKQLSRDARKYPAIMNGALSRQAYFAQQDEKRDAKKEIDRPTPFTLKAILYKKSTVAKLTSSVFINPRNSYLHYIVYGGTRRSAGRILVPGRDLRSNQYGNLPRAKRRRLIKSPKTFRIGRGQKKVLMRRVRKKLVFFASLEQQTRYDKQWDFHKAALRSFDKRFEGLLRIEHRRFIKDKI